ncbi:amidohydrolase family protein [Nocardioides ganghwensis]|uniref:Peptidase n=1 Tax=Nocardioides ganghwensis TaxID=252230 RepID=A0A4Q2SHK1_9ACTN|nr:peptidase [Nocardioides ganghwensis]MBD3945016.1 peptidase [Nocardioides ganghwensis]RYC04985.1 peptidase [Nocardioides ganghwensis]
MTPTPRPVRRIVTSLLAAGGLVVGAVLTAAPTGSGAASLPTTYDAGHGHVHDDPTTKNALSRSGEAAAHPARTTPRQRAASRARVSAQRTQREPRLTGVPLRSPRRKVPESVYAMAGGCYRLGGQSLTFQATGLGTYLLHAPDRTFLAATGADGATWAADPSPLADWTAREVGKGRFTFTLADGRSLRRAGDGFGTGTPQAFALRRTSGCVAFPEVETNVRGRPFGGVTSYQEVRGWVDPHVHGQTHEFLGGRVICSPPFHPYGAPAALVDCPDHRVADGRGALLEDALAERAPGTGHDPVGWPTFSYWPNPHSLTHQQVYYKWLERSWRAGLRIHTSLLTENHVLCTVYPLKKNSCDDRDAVRLQARRMREMQDYVDAQHGGPGRGWYRIVTDPFEARRVINQGKLAVVMGMETSVPLGCNVQLGRPTCTEEQMLAELAEMRRLGVSQMELTNKFDNAFTGVAGDAGTTGTLTNSANFLSTGSFLRMQRCPATHPPGTEDRLQSPNLGDLPGGGQSTPEQDAIFGAIWKLYGDTGIQTGVQPAPVYPAGPHCNQLGLSPLGERLLSAMTDHRILVDPDHMSVAGRTAALDYLERQQAAGRPVGVVSSHSWSTPDAYPRIYRLGGFVAPYAGDSTGFVAKWRQHLGWTDRRYYFGFGFGSDMNGFGAQGDPRGAEAPAPVTYPFRGLGGVTVDRQRSGERVYDVNTDGVAHYGLYADWVEDAQHVAGADGAALGADLARGAEAYLQTWERAWGLAPDSCRNPGLRRPVRSFTRAAEPGIRARALMRRVGQPWQRLGREFTYCAKAPGKQRVLMTVRLSRGGKVQTVRRG